MPGARSHLAKSPNRHRARHTDPGLQRFSGGNAGDDRGCNPADGAPRGGPRAGTRDSVGEPRQPLERCPQQSEIAKPAAGTPEALTRMVAGARVAEAAPCARGNKRRRGAREGRHDAFQRDTHGQRQRIAAKQRRLAWIRTRRIALEAVGSNALGAEVVTFGGGTMLGRSTSRSVRWIRPRGCSKRIHDVPDEGSGRRARNAERAHSEDSEYKTKVKAICSVTPTFTNGPSVCGADWGREERRALPSRGQAAGWTGAGWRDEIGSGSRRDDVATHRDPGGELRSGRDRVATMSPRTATRVASCDRVGIALRDVATHRDPSGELRSGGEMRSSCDRVGIALRDVATRRDPGGELRSGRDRVAMMSPRTATRVARCDRVGIASRGCRHAPRPGWRAAIGSGSRCEMSSRAATRVASCDRVGIALRDVVTRRDSGGEMRSGRDRVATMSPRATIMLRRSAGWLRHSPAALPMMRGPGRRQAPSPPIRSRRCPSSSPPAPPGSGAPCRTPRTGSRSTSRRSAH